ncbi:MAG TPA: ankyrin repeat domain-containing protein, partial [Candidatus Bathyarchaeia archaeon]|nr:ankyrin repeat domain-containing protein [Candidatus Bathyarchaeia archaeon]
MKRLALAFLGFFVVAAPARPQEIFDLLRKGDVAAVKALIGKSPQLVTAKDADGDTPLHYAAVGKDPGLIGFLVDKGAKVDAIGAGAKTPLHLAAQSDNREAVAALIKRGAAIDIKDDYARTALVLCARERGRTETGRLLIDAGADVNAADKFGDTALNLAAWRGKASFVDLLLEKGAKVPPPGRQWWTVLTSAASKGLPNLFRLMTEKGPDLKASESADFSLLNEAAKGGSREIVGILIDKGLDPAHVDRLGWTPLHYAALFGGTEAARRLIELGAPLDACSLAGQTAYNVAVERKMEAVARLLAEKGADTSAIRFPELKGSYAGQKPPADKPEIFGLGIVSSIWGLHSTVVFSPDGNEVYWAPMVEYPGGLYARGGILMMERVDGRWTPPALAPFSGPDDGDVPFFSQDGRRVYFISARALPGASEGGKECIWYADRTPSGWSEPRPLDRTVNEHAMHWSFSLDRSGNLYFGGRGPDSRGMNDIYMARYVDGKYEKPINLGDPISTAAEETTPFVAPDGSYLIFSRNYDLWVSFRAKDGSWGAPVSLGPEINSEAID